MEGSHIGIKDNLKGKYILISCIFQMRLRTSELWGPIKHYVDVDKDGNKDNFCTFQAKTEEIVGRIWNPVGQ